MNRWKNWPAIGVRGVGCLLIKSWLIRFVRTGKNCPSLEIERAFWGKGYRIRSDRGGKKFRKISKRFGPINPFPYNIQSTLINLVTFDGSRCFFYLWKISSSFFWFTMNYKIYLICKMHKKKIMTIIKFLLRLFYY